jgi:sugar O-acyltransferase (sialic acid O-acetyltransferase NeuD family)
VAAQGLVVVGAGGHGREVLVVALAAGRPVLGVLDDGTPGPGLLAALGVEHLGPVDWLGTATPVPEFAAGVGDPAGRRAVVQRAEQAGARAAVLVHPSAEVGHSVELAAGAVVWPQVALTVQVRVGRHSHLNVASSISHDVVIGDFVTVGPGARVCGAVRLEDDVWVGAGATILQGVRVGAGTVIGAGAVVLRDVRPGLVVAGVPARPLPRTDGTA